MVAGVRSRDHLSTTRRPRTLAVTLGSVRSLSLSRIHLPGSPRMLRFSSNGRVPMHRGSVTGITFVAILVGTVAVSTSTSARPSGPSGGTVCFGAQADIVGTPGDDVLEGTPARDVIAGLGGDDSIAGAGGNDTVCGGTGRDDLVGGGGNDTMLGGGSLDVVTGGGGHDLMYGNAGATP